MPSPPRVRFAPAIDLACITAFVLVGGWSHDELHEGLAWFVRVMWPLCVGFFVLALMTRLYSRTAGVWSALAITCVGGVVLTQLLRGTFTGHPYLSVFALIALTFLALTTFGWRLVGGLLARRLIS
ncbi:MAG TPA: DUF3054 family protein [Acidimicrobiia bacterium]|nr:DUF3054 family protein [Acidimicrobiia bacterium]